MRLIPGTDGNLALFRDNLVALVGPKNDSTTALVWHPIKYSEADTVLPFTQVNGSGELLDFAILHQKRLVLPQVLAYDGIPEKNKWTIDPDVPVDKVEWTWSNTLGENCHDTCEKENMRCSDEFFDDAVPTGGHDEAVAAVYSLYCW